MTQNVYGHQQNLKILNNAIEKNRVAHAYQFSGPEGVGKLNVARHFLASLFCNNKKESDFACGECSPCKKLTHENHPDVYFLQPLGARIKIEQIRQLQKTFHYKPYEAAYKVYLIKDADTMTTEAANSLLKILEEPPVETVFILITAKPYAMLSTINSRCQHIYFQKLGLEEVENYLRDKSTLSHDQVTLFASLADGSLAKAENLATSHEITDIRKELIELMQMVLENDQVKIIRINSEWEKRKEQFPLMLELLELFYRDLLILKETKNKSLILNKDEQLFLEEMVQYYRYTDLTELILQLERLRKYMTQNVNFKLILDNLFLVLKAS